MTLMILVKISTGIKLPSVQGRIQFVDISFHYPTRAKAPVLQNVNLSINPGELVAIVSPASVVFSRIFLSWNSESVLFIYFNLVYVMLLEVSQIMSN
jgi:ABC-type multidrug transport system fused ATPase/permease subunit